MHCVQNQAVGASVRRLLFFGFYNLQASPYTLLLTHVNDTQITYTNTYPLTSHRMSPNTPTCAALNAHNWISRSRVGYPAPLGCCNITRIRSALINHTHTSVLYRRTLSSSHAIAIRAQAVASLAPMALRSPHTPPPCKRSRTLTLVPHVFVFIDCPCGSASSRSRNESEHP